jgi:hypothetical protein
MADKRKNELNDAINKLNVTMKNARIGAVFPTKDNQNHNQSNSNGNENKPPRGGDGDKGSGSPAKKKEDGGSGSKKKRRGKNNNNGGRKDYGKVLTVFKCGNEACGNQWQSVHGWTKLTPLVCDCQSKAKVIKMIEDMLCVVEYRCVCGEHWPMPHDDGHPGPIELDCDCGLKAIAGGPQQRFGRQYWIRCLRPEPECGLEWEEVSLETDYTQKCKKCFTSGNKVGTRTENGNTRNGTGGRGGFPFWMRGGSHNVEFCDMCQLLRSQGQGGSCVPKKRVMIQEVTVDGVRTDRVVGTLDMRREDVPRIPSRI